MDAWLGSRVAVPVCARFKRGALSPRLVFDASLRTKALPVGISRAPVDLRCHSGLRSHREAMFPFLSGGESILLLRDLVRRKVLREHAVADTSAVSRESFSSRFSRSASPVKRGRRYP